MLHSTDDSSSPSIQEDVPNEHALISQAQAGDEQAFKTIYERYFDRIALYLTRMVGKDDIGSELTQDTFLRAWRALPNLRQTETFLGWLYRIATHIAYDYQRRKKHLSLTSYDEEPTLIDLSSSEDIEGQVIAEELLRLALTCVPEKHRNCLILYHVQGHSKPEIAELLHLQEGSVSTYISLGMEEFRRIHHHLQVENAAMVERRKEQ